MIEEAKWIAQRFGQAELGDIRRSKRAQALALKMLEGPGQGLPKQAGTWTGVKAAYRLLNHESVSREKLLKPHIMQTRLEVDKRQPEQVKLFIQDTTELDLTTLKSTEGLGPIGNHKGQGMLVHSVLAMSQQGQVYGLAAQRCWVRQQGKGFSEESRWQRQKRQDKESNVWLKGLQSVGSPKAGQRWISVADRGSDCFDYWQKAKALGWDCLSRVFTDRCLSEEGAKLITRVRKLTSQGRLSVAQRARPGQAGRTLQLEVAWQQVNIRAPRNTAGCEQTALPVSLVRCWDTQHAVEWLLLATWPVGKPEQAMECVRWYTQRWSIEEFHKCLKTGCRIEATQLKQARAIEALLAFSSVVAVHLLALARRSQSACAQQLAAQHIDALYLRVLCAKQNLNPSTLTLKQYWREIARMGGFLARNSDGDPGWQTLWKGLMDLEALISGYCLALKCG
jgi:hypothetical protein